MNWSISRVYFAALLLAWVVSARAADRVGISVAERAADNSVEAQLAQFELADGYNVNLFASEEDGIANPIAMRWDAAGRLWVLTTLAYAQVEPGGKPNDQLLILEDTDGDGRVDKTEIWADGLAMPTGFALGHGGVYLAEGEGLFFLSDADGDGKADTRKQVLTGFGTGDTHQNINSLSWGPAGDLWFTQGLHNFSRVETPWGIVRGEEAGFWRLRIRDLKLEPFCMGSMASQNPWGLGWDRWGAMFLKSNNTQLGYVSPGIIPTNHHQELMRRATVAATPGKSMGCEVVESSHLPELRDHVLIAGYFANRVTAFPLIEDGAGFQKTEGQTLLLSKHTSFRPVEVKVGPDGGIYVADWFNPIIGHYQASLRHPDRDRVHGRVWRVTRKGREPVVAPKLTEMTTVELWAQLDSPERWVRDQAQRQLADTADATEVEKLFAANPMGLAGVQVLESLGRSSGITFCLDSTEPLVRAYGARMIGRWETETERLSALVADAHPRVRLEAIVSAAHLGTAEAMSHALLALDSPRDTFIDYALTQTVHALADVWLPALREGRMHFANPEQLAFAVSTYGGSGANRVLEDLLASATPESKRELLLVLAQVGGPEQLRLAIEALPTDLELLSVLQKTMRVRQVRPAGSVGLQLEAALKHVDEDVRAAAVELAGLWKVRPLAGRLLEMAGDGGTPSQIRIAAMTAVARIPDSGAVPTLNAAAQDGSHREIQTVAIAAMAGLDLNRAAELTAGLLQAVDSVDRAAALLAPFLSRDAGSRVLAKHLAASPLENAAASRISQALARLGRNDSELLAVINEKLGVPIGVMEHDPAFVRELVAEVQTDGDPVNGKRVYHSPLLSCVACHAVEGSGGILGPELTTVGAGVPVDLLVEALLWPGRQLKEGYFSVSVVTKDGRAFNGYREREADGVLWLRDVVSGKVEPIPLNQIQKRDDIGTLMPSGLTASLSRKDLRDLVAYLSSLR